MGASNSQAISSVSYLYTEPLPSLPIQTFLSQMVSRPSFSSEELPAIKLISRGATCLRIPVLTPKYQIVLITLPLIKCAITCGHMRPIFP